MTMIGSMKESLFGIRLLCAGVRITERASRLGIKASFRIELGVLEDRDIREHDNK